MAITNIYSYRLEIENRSLWLGKRSWFVAQSEHEYCLSFVYFFISSFLLSEYIKFWSFI